MRLRCANSISTFLRSRREVRPRASFQGKVDSLCSPFSLVVHDPESTFELRALQASCFLAPTAARSQIGGISPLCRISGCSYLWAFTSASSFSSFLTCSCSVDRRELSSPMLTNVTLLAGASSVLP